MNLPVCAFLSIALGAVTAAGATAPSTLDNLWTAWTPHDAAPGEFILGSTAAFVRREGTSDPYISRPIPYGKHRYLFKARYRTDGKLSPTALVFLPPEVDRRPLVSIRLPASAEWRDFETVLRAHDSKQLKLELRLYPGTLDGYRMKEGGLKSLGHHAGRAEFQSISWTQLPDPIEDLSKGPGTFTTQKIVFKKVGDLELTVHVDQPAGLVKPRSGIIWYHGGGFVGGNPDSCLLQTTYFASRGIPCVRPQYRLVQQGGNVDTTLSDFMDGIAWVKQHGREYGIDPDRLIIAGTSAGAVLGSIVALKTPGCLGFIGVCGYYDAVEPGDSAGIDKRSDFFRGGADPEIWKRASAIYQIPRNPPPAFLVHGFLDATLDYRQTTHYAAALQRAGGHVQVEIVPDLNHVPNLIPEAVFTKMQKFVREL